MAVIVFVLCYCIPIAQTVTHYRSQSQPYRFDSQDVDELIKYINVSLFQLPSVLVVSYPAEPTPGCPQPADAGTATAAQSVEVGYRTRM